MNYFIEIAEGLTLRKKEVLGWYLSNHDKTILTVITKRAGNIDIKCDSEAQRYAHAQNLRECVVALSPLNVNRKKHKH